ncbi:MAG: hypothetical protein WD898_00410 [Candidatus Paceibacterota bacterium]
MNETHHKLARLLRSKPEFLFELEKKMDAYTGKSGVMDKVLEENDLLVNRTLQELGLDRNECRAKIVYDALVQRLTHMDEHIFKVLDKPDLSKLSMNCGKLCEIAIQLNEPKKGFFIKREKATEMLEQFPPQNLLDFFGYGSVRELIEKEGFASVFSSLRFAQDKDWMHKFFDEAYSNLSADDFEERDVELKVLELKWLDVAEKFLDKKYHNLSHLKEFGVIFVVPLKIDTPGETLRMFTLMLHYLNEVPFYSKLFRKYSKDSDFSDKLKSLLRGDVSEDPIPESKHLSFRIVQRYLAKDDEQDFRLAEPHFNPEVEHWFRAENDLAKLSKMPESEAHQFGYWQGLDFVGDFFKDGLGGMGKGDEVLISFDLIDLVMSLVQKGEIKYLYHQQEALWNKIFIEYLGRGKMEELVEDNIVNGFIKL